ncbi:Hsp20/alpha crystallin family protein [Fulvivirga sedimenti]|uniref:Hsp20/alpha crystallin family protein n=1 Tax=Fulvivirga sedimenti TaxID=2879465 RepID=A0A9X1HR97_9BACT|nr:Hsp20/alpha crystallin family protein [Fulvivirga sedimenti]MCA6074909.1 Hsp20/alpha crystallin family protein [Fulvivirga sedimenti]MCA6076086.1 Hsp20/alpha crystallin family protein [Fulvivirga sedimenti]MCA6077214.1 Hsp20/alpha crystallin family protein [Fulvivirga sedimenti]
MLPLHIRNNPFHRIGDSYGHFIDYGHFMGRSAFDDRWLTKPMANIIEAEDEYKIELTMPGFSKEDITIELKNDIIKVKAERKRTQQDELIHQEVPGRLSERSFEIADAIDQDRIHASLDKGILTIYMPHKTGVQHISRKVMVE